MNFFEIIEAAPEIGLKLLTPGTDLDKPVEGIDVSETPDIHNYIVPKTLLLTTAMLYRDDTPGLIRLIENLHAAGVSGLAVKLGRFISQIGPKVLARAEELNFPVFQIPVETTLGIAAHRLQSVILGVETRQLYYALDIQKKISALLHQDASLEELLQYFARLLKQHVLYFDYFFDQRAQGQAHDATFRLGRDQISAIGAALQSIHAQRPIISIEEFILPGEDGEFRCLVVPVKAGREFPCFLVIVYDREMPEFFSYFVAESASNVFAFAAHNQHRLLIKDWDFSEEAFRRLMERKDPLTITDIRGLSMSYNYTGSGPWQLVGIGFEDDNLSDDLKKLDTFALVYNWLRKKMRHMEALSILVPLPSERRFVLLLREPAVLLRSLLRSIGDGLKEHVDLSLKFGVANQFLELDSLRFAYIQAFLALGEVLEDHREAINFYHSKGVQELFQFVPPEHIRHYCLHTLKELAYPESEYDRELRQTLEIFLNNQGDISRTAKKLEIHRNTVKYRIDKARHAGLLSDNTDQSLELRLAILLSKIGLDNS